MSSGPASTRRRAPDPRGSRRGPGRARRQRFADVEAHEVAFEQLDRSEPVEPLVSEREHVRGEVDANVRGRARLDDRFRNPAGAAAEVEDVRARMLRDDRDRQLPSAPGPSPENVVARARPRVEAVDRVGAPRSSVASTSLRLPRSPSDDLAWTVDYLLRSAVQLGKNGTHSHRRRAFHMPSQQKQSRRGATRDRRAAAST